MKRAIIAACAGTADVRAAEECIRPAEDALRAAFPDREIRRVFTSRKIAARTGTDTETEAAARLREEGFDEIVIASMHLLPGSEYARLAGTGLPVTAPLLEGGCAQIAALLETVRASEGRTLLALGHPSEAAAGTWARLEGMLSGNVLPARLDDDVAAVAARLPRDPVTVMPLMLTAGRHARRDAEGRWLPALAALGFDVRMRMEGLGARREIQKMIVENVREIIGGNENG